MDDGAYYEVQQGDNLTLIALQFGFADHHAIYDHPKNADFKKRRPDPDILHPGDRIFIPPLTDREETRSSDALHRFVKKTPTKTLRIRVQDADGTALEGVDYTLILEATGNGPNVKGSDRLSLKGQTKDGGLIEREVPVNISKGTLQVGEVTWNLAIGDLNPHQKTPDLGTSGIQARLRNLGFDPGLIDGKMGPHTEAAILAFQRKHPPLTADGICGPKTTARLVEEHGS